MNKTIVVNKRKEPYDVFIGRPGKWGNPFVMGRYTREEAVQLHADWILTQPKLLAAIKPELQGRRLGCFCKPLACHGDILAKLADE